MSEGTAIVFPGQGSQRPGMGKDFHEKFAAARAVYDEASVAAGIDLAALCFGKDERLGLTEFTQPAILTTEIAMLRALEAEHGLRGDVFAGHSLGEYVALVAAGVMSLADAVRLVRRRGALMQQAVPAGEGAMVAVIGAGLELDRLREQVADLGVDAANHNSPSQVVLSGPAAGVAEATKRLAAEGRRCVALEVSAPFHSRMMRGIEDAFAGHLASVELDLSRAPAVASNFTGGFHEASADSIRGALVRQIAGTVRWVDNMRAIAPRAKQIVELGPGRPLTGFFKELGVATVAVRNLREAEKAFKRT
ncbi:MAG: ACP S-malonyltransferase [Candidatus Binatia bacterium]